MFCTTKSDSNKGGIVMSFIQILIIALVVLMFVLMFMEVAHPATIAFLTVLVFFILGLISPEEVMETVSNEGVLTLALLFIVVSVIERTNITEIILSKILRKSRSDRGTLLRLSPPLIGLSAFLNNTPLVVMMTTAMQNWCKDRDLHPSKFLLPISYVTIFGGMFTLIGTSTNLIVHGWLIERDFTGFSFFHLVPYIIVGVAIGLVYLILFSDKILPENETTITGKYNEGRKFLYEAIVEEKCALIGKTVTSEEFERLKDLYLLKIIRDDETISPVRLNDVIHEKDTLVFTGTLDSLKSLEQFRNLSIKTDKDLSYDTLQTEDSRLIEGVISHNSSLVHQQIKRTNFRAKYDASIVSVHRKNENINQNIGDIRLKVGDVLLLLAGKDFEQHAYQNDDFYALSEIPTSKVLNKKESIISISAFVLMILSVAFGFLTMFQAVLFCIGLFMLLRLLDPEQIRQSIPFQVLLLIVASLGIGKVMETSGVAELIANSIIHLVAENFGVIGLLMAIYLITNLLTEVITNTASAVIVLPISVEVASYMGIEPNMIAVIVAVAASASFSTPIGYQTNLIVYGPGGYKFSDYVKLGLPLNIIFLLSVVFSVYLFL